MVNLKAGLKTLFESRTMLYRTLIDMDASLRYFSPNQSKIEQIKSFLDFDLTTLKPISAERLFGISSETLQLEAVVHIEDKELERVTLKEFGIVPPDNNKFTYNLTIYKVD